MALRVNVSGDVLSVVYKPETKGDDGKVKKAYREVHLIQKDEDGTPQKHKIKVWDSSIEINEGTHMILPCNVRSWGMKNDRGDFKHGIDLSVVDSNRR